MDFAALPPEINSAKMYAGPGAGPMLAAAAAWDEMSAELYRAAASHYSVISSLSTTVWQGPSSLAMAAAAATQVAWTTAAAAVAEQTAIAAKAAAAAYETAFAMTVAPPLIAANRALLMALVDTNFLGQNAPAIAATEAQYAQMWAQDAAAMYGYAGASAAACSLTPFARPALSGLSALSGHVSISSLEIASLPLLGVRIATIPATYITAALGGKNVGNMLERLSNLPAALAAKARGGPGGLTIVGNPTPVSATLGRATTIGKLSVPRSWVASAPTTRTVAVTIAPTAASGRTASLWPKMALAAMTGRAVGAVASSRNK